MWNVAKMNILKISVDTANLWDNNQRFIFILILIILFRLNHNPQYLNPNPDLGFPENFLPPCDLLLLILILTLIIILILVLILIPRQPDMRWKIVLILTILFFFMFLILILPRQPAAARGRDGGPARPRQTLLWRQEWGASRKTQVITLMFIKFTLYHLI